MGLSNQQIERYARQIIVPGIGGGGQERLLAARLMLLGTAAELAPTLAYLVGAGIGQIQLLPSAYRQAEGQLLLARMHDLNSEVSITPATGAPVDLVFALVGEERVREMIQSPAIALGAAAIVMVQLDAPGSIAILTARPPCPLCADIELDEDSAHQSSTGHGHNAGVVAMIAVTEAIKLLAYSARPSPTLLQFNRFECTPRQLRQRPDAGQCACSAYRAD